MANIRQVTPQVRRLKKKELTISGLVKEGGTPVEGRTVVLFKRYTGEAGYVVKLAETRSQADGSFSFTFPASLNDKFLILALPRNINFNAAVYDFVTGG